MGTEYDLYKDNLGKLSISEMSNKLSLIFDEFMLTGFTRVKSSESIICISKQISPEEMTKIMLKGLTVCSYWMDQDELKELIKDHMDKEVY